MSPISWAFTKFTTMENVKEIMKHEQNPLNNNWLCWIPNTPQAYYCSTKKAAKDFCDQVNEAFAKGELTFNDQGKVVKMDLKQTL